MPRLLLVTGSTQVGQSEVTERASSVWISRIAKVSIPDARTPVLKRPRRASQRGESAPSRRGHQPSCGPATSEPHRVERFPYLSQREQRPSPIELHGRQRFTDGSLRPYRVHRGRSSVDAVSRAIVFRSFCLEGELALPSPLPTVRQHTDQSR